MATVRGATAERVQEVEDASIVGAAMSGNDLVFTTHGGQQINVGRIIPPAVNNWPIGSIFMNTSATNPATLLGGGTWVRWGQGRMPVSQDPGQTEFDVAEETGGAKTHTLSVAEMPAHAHGGLTGSENANHTHTGYTSSDGNHAHSTPSHNHPGINVNGNTLEWKQDAFAAGAAPGVSADGEQTITGNYGGAGTTGAAGTHNHSVQTYGQSNNHQHAVGAEGGGTAHNNLPPYIVVYMWKRTV